MDNTWTTKQYLTTVYDYGMHRKVWVIRSYSGTQDGQICSLFCPKGNEYRLLPTTVAYLDHSLPIPRMVSYLGGNRERKSRKWMYFRFVITHYVYGGARPPVLAVHIQAVRHGSVLQRESSSCWKRINLYSSFTPLCPCPYKKRYRCIIKYKISASCVCRGTNRTSSGWREPHSASFDRWDLADRILVTMALGIAAGHGQSREVGDRTDTWNSVRWQRTPIRCLLW